MALMEDGVLALSAGPTVIRLLPPLTITREELDSVNAKLLQVLTK
jgi:acetylornithine/succinyldiaminopimelate/putrescine aminotransferase